jgi:hypothetical protein
MLQQHEIMPAYIACGAVEHLINEHVLNLYLARLWHIARLVGTVKIMIGIGDTEAKFTAARQAP